MSSPEAPKSASAQIEFQRREPDVLVAALSGEWKAARGLPPAQLVREECQRESSFRRVTFDMDAVTDWDSGLVSFLLQCHRFCAEAGLAFDQQSLPPGVGRLIELALAVPEREGARRGPAHDSFVHQIGLGAMQLSDALRLNFHFVGECVLAFTGLLRGRIALRWSDTLLLMQRCGSEALPIVALIGFLMGAIVAFVGAVQLAQFGASIYVADMVGVAMAREMGCIMTGIIMCGRTGAAYAAELGTMKVNQELDAFRVLGIAPVDFLVAPRILALFLMLPLLTLFAVFVGIAGGFAVAMLMLDMHAAEYWVETVHALNLSHLCVGMIKSLVFGVLIGVTSCQCGLQCGSDAAAVGKATTAAVVTGITWLIVADAIFAVVFTALHI